ncbi:MAG: polysaccharide biosynthesis tyrosine autokinase [Pirellulales bacterium]|nr:polysaccharide biosynthesis tyrosine autokinase [Pirellulales bacterium]
MSHEASQPLVHVEPQSSKLMLHMMLQFLGAVRYRKGIIIVTLAVASLLGGIYFAVATRYYGAKAGMLMMNTGTNNLDSSMTGEVAEQAGVMKTFENVIKSPRVLDGALAKLRKQDRVDLAGIPPERWIDVLSDSVTTKTVTATNILEVSFQSKRPEVAVNVVNAIVDSYFEFLHATRQGIAGEISRVLTKERVELAEKLHQKQQELIQARSYFGDVGSQEGSRILHPVIKRAMFFSDELNEVQRDRIQLQATLAAVRSAVQKGESIQQHLISIADVVGKEFLLRTFGMSNMDTRTRTALEEVLLTDRADLQAMQGRLGGAHPAMIARQEKVRQTEDYLTHYQERSAEHMMQVQQSQLGPILIEMIQQKLNEAAQRELSLQAQFNASQAEAVNHNARLATLEMLEHDVKRLRELGDVLVKQIASIDLQQGGQGVQAALIDPPKVDERPVSPKLSKVILLVLLGGLGSGLATVYVMDLLDDRFRSIEDLQQQLGVPVLSMIRQLSTPESTGPNALQVHVAPAATESEAFRTLRTALALADEKSTRLVVTSAEPGDGKTTVLANLAVCYAQSGKKTLLIDADLRRPGLTQLLQMRSVEGLSTILKSDEDLVELATAFIQASGIDKLDVLPAGPRMINPAELLTSSRLGELIEWAATVYDQILIDTPPVLVTSDAALAGRLVDGVILVVQPDKNRRHMVVRAIDSLVSLNIPVPGVVVNRIRPEHGQGYYGYESGYSYGSTDDYVMETGMTEMPTPETVSWPSDDLSPQAGIVPRRAA